jgi:thiol:disulfide interchange protein
MRTGNEPLQARSPLKIRFGLALWGLVWAVAGAVAFVMAGRPEWAAACAALALLATMDLAIVIRHIHQGPHYQPGKSIPPYEPDRGSNGSYLGRRDTRKRRRRT